MATGTATATDRSLHQPRSARSAISAGRAVSRPGAGVTCALRLARSSEHVGVSIGGMLWRVRTTLDDRPGALAELTTACGSAGVNILGLQVFPGIERVTDELVLRTPDDWDLADLADLVERSGGTRVSVLPCTDAALADQPTRYVVATRGILAEPASFPDVVARLFDAEADVSGAGLEPVMDGMDLEIGDVVGAAAAYGAFHRRRARPWCGPRRAGGRRARRRRPEPRAAGRLRRAGAGLRGPRGRGAGRRCRRRRRLRHVDRRRRAGVARRAGGRPGLAASPHRVPTAPRDGSRRTPSDADEIVVRTTRTTPPCCPSCSARACAGGSGWAPTISRSGCPSAGLPGCERPAPRP